MPILHETIRMDFDANPFNWILSQLPKVQKYRLQIHPEEVALAERAIKDANLDEASHPEGPCVIIDPCPLDGYAVWGGDECYFTRGCTPRGF